MKNNQPFDPSSAEAFPVYMMVFSTLALVFVIILSADPLRKFITLFPLYPLLITWILQKVLKFDKGYIAVVFCLSFAVGTYGARHHYINRRGGGFLVPEQHMVMVSICLFIAAIWQYVIICKNRNTKTNKSSDPT